MQQNSIENQPLKWHNFTYNNREQKSHSNRKSLPNLSKTIEQEQKIVTPIDKKVIVLSKYRSKKEDKNILDDILPSSFNNKINDDHILKIQTQQSFILECLGNDKKNYSLRLEMAENALFIAEIYRSFLKAPDLEEGEKEEYEDEIKTFVNTAKEENQDAKTLNPFHALHYFHYYIEALIMEFGGKKFEGVDCKNIEEVEKYVRLLKLALSLETTKNYKNKIEQMKDKAVTFLERRWKKLETEGIITNNQYQDWTAQLNDWLNSDPLKELFYNDPDLFKLSSKTEYREFFDMHPELKSIDAFVTKYPEVQFIRVNVLNKEILSEVLNRKENLAFAEYLYLIKKDAILANVVASVIVNGMLNYFNNGRILQVYLGNNDDAQTIEAKFNETIKKSNKNEIKIETKIDKEIKGIDYPVYIVYLSNK